MPRITTSLLRKARTIDPFLSALLAPCRDLHTAQNELRWLYEHVEKVSKTRRARGGAIDRSALLRQLVKERAKGKPLQYLLGTEYFGGLEIQCRPGVLIPRQDTATSVSHLVQLICGAQKLPNELRILDLCTGTGCIPLLFDREFHSSRKNGHICLLGIDVSDKSLALARHNLNVLHKSRKHGEYDKISFLKADVLADSSSDISSELLSLKTALDHGSQPQFWDILISNPPYISPSEYWKTTTRSVRGFEPKLALVPPSATGYSDTQQGDLFYPRLLEIARDVQAKIVLLEVADLNQALRVAQYARDLYIFDGVEIWREEPSCSSDSTDENGFSIFGQGNARSVLCWRGEGTNWLGKTRTATSA
ncbi:S-adenosyl-L-methionine-dependent methyltransferase [Dothidotthia symphoricarpi CBS 119687]|uniref:S-adenosyl-L-methionine-dependent methyltransferase n=1 Tax=Dothidotthia symphoricarpi CBS 119687 TaxID=1392245 RepID=A0A6A6ADK0_9PLEO|nr:S-adenosyl-L-methionine-dependent methyltransferase [Dothidotthia symphoricarpi CBS 119687]KAF2128811.1 S-adenosyl-L-methionine-dependent methyltransferase [Dothidotthia symphoricarpi CBS 119687]